MLSAGVYRFSGARDDGLRAYIDNVPVVDEWTFGSDQYSVDKVVLGGPHELRVEYFEAGGGARAEFTYERIGDVVSRGRRVCRRVLRQPKPVGDARSHPSR